MDDSEADSKPKAWKWIFIMHFGYALITLVWLVGAIFVHVMNFKTAEFNEVNDLLVGALKDMSQAGLAGFICLWVLSWRALKEERTASMVSGSAGK